MNQVADILNLANRVQQQNVEAVLATVVRTEGSAYRHAGAMMLICADGRSVGMISGGCLEPHIIKRAFWLTRNGASVQTYQTGDDVSYSDDTDTGTDIETNTAELTVASNIGNRAISDSDSDAYSYIDSDDDVDALLDGELNFGLGCNGRVHVLFERLSTAMSLLDSIQQVRNSQQPLTIATLISCDNLRSHSPQLPIGIRLDIDAYRATGQVATIDGRQVFSEASAAAIGFIHNVITKLSAHTFDKKNADYMVIDSDIKSNITSDIKGNVDDAAPANASQCYVAQSAWLIQQIRPQIRLLICGAGNDVMPLVTMAKLQDWQVTVIDSRAQYATKARFPQADKVLCLPVHDHETLTQLSAGAAVAVMSHSLTQDRARLAILLTQPNFSYVGQLGPRYRTERLIKEISASLNKADDFTNIATLTDAVTKLHYPIGYKLGGDGPEALALSIMAQISAVIYQQAQPVIDNQVELSVIDSELSLDTQRSSVEQRYAHD